MRATEFLNEGVDRSVDDIKQNHPEIWNFFRKTGQWMALEQYGKVNSFDMGGNHTVSINITPTAGLENLKLILKDEGFDYQETENFGNVGLHGTIPGTKINWSTKNHGPRGNMTSSWDFTMPQKDDKKLKDLSTWAKDPAVQEATGSSLSPKTQEYLDRFKGNVKKALEHANMLASMGRDPAWLPIINELGKLARNESIEEDRGDDREYGIFYSKPRAEAQTNPANHAPVDGKVYPSKDHAVAAQQRWNKTKPDRVRVRLVKPMAKAMLVAKKYNDKNYFEGGSYVRVDNPKQVTVMSLDDGQPMFIGSPLEFAKWAKGKNESVEEATDEEHAAWLKRRNSPEYDYKRDEIDSMKHNKKLSKDYFDAQAQYHRDQDKKDREEAKFAADQIKNIFRN